MRRRTGIEPADDAARRPPVLKTEGATRHPDASTADVTRVRRGFLHLVASTFDRVTHTAVRLTQYAHGGGCACKIPPGELEETVASLIPDGQGTDLMVGVEHGDDGA